jgi:cell wall-associated NlpC family hydrolase
VIIKRGCLFITIVLLLLFPWQTFGASSNKNIAKKNQPQKLSKGSAKKSTPTQIKTANKKSKKSLRAKKKRTQQVAQDRPATAKDAPPLIKITPLENGKFLLEPMDSSLNSLNKGTESLSGIKKPFFDEELKEEDLKENNTNPLVNFPNLLIDISKQLLGKSYRLGGNGQGEGGIDCSGFVRKIYQALSLSLPHSSREQAKLGSLVTTEWDLSQLRIGDLLFFKRNRGAQIGHTGMYIGEGKMIHSASKKGVVISNLKASNYYNKNFVMAKRLFILDDPQKDEVKENKEGKEP